MNLLTEVFKGKIPKDKYQIALNVRDIAWGNTIKLKSDKHEFLLYFHTQLELRMFKRSLGIQRIMPLEWDSEICDNHFSNVIYEIQDSDMKREFEHNAYMEAGSGKFRHFVVIGEKVVLDILAFTDDVKLYPKIIDGKPIDDELFFSL